MGGRNHPEYAYLHNIDENQSSTATNTKNSADKLIDVETKIQSLKDLNAQGFVSINRGLTAVETAIGESGNDSTGSGEVSSVSDWNEAYTAGMSNIDAEEFTGTPDLTEGQIFKSSHVPGLTSIPDANGLTGENWLIGVFDDIVSNNPVSSYAANSSINTVNPVCSITDTIDMFDRTMTLELSMCQWQSQLQMLGNLMFAFTGLFSFIMIFRRS